MTTGQGKTGTIEVDVAVPCAAWAEAVRGVDAVARRAAEAAYGLAAAQGGGQAPAEAAIVLADDAFVRTLNRDYRGRDEATDVLSFAAGEGDAGPRPEGAPLLLGDVVIAYETAAREAAEQGNELAEHLSHLVIHGMLHLLGHDHRTSAEAEAMERLEVRALARIGVSSPYAADDSR